MTSAGHTRTYTLKCRSLLQAVHRGNMKTVLQLLEKNVSLSVDMVDDQGTTGELNTGAPLIMVATRANHLDLVQILLHRGATVDGAKPNAATALYIAVQEGFSDLAIALLCCGAFPNVCTKGDDEASAMLMAAQDGLTETVAILLAAGADPLKRATDDTSALYFACQEGHEAMVELLLPFCQSDVNRLTQTGHLPLHRACANGHYGIAQRLLAAKADPAGVEPSSFLAPLHFAVVHHHCVVVSALLRHNVDVNAFTSYADPTDRDTPLTFAASEGPLDVALALLSSGADLKMNLIDGKQSPLDVAAANGPEFALMAIAFF